MTAPVTQPFTDTSRLTVERITDVAGFDSLREEWADLLEESDSDCLFLTWEWLYTWWKHLAGDRELAIVAVRCEGRLAALAPLCNRPASMWHRRLLPVSELLGSGSVGSDYLDFIVRRGCETEALRAFASLLGQERLVLDWRQLRRGSCFVGDVASHLARGGWILSETVTNTCPFIPLSGVSWEMYLAGLGSEHRYDFNRKWRRLKRDYTVQFEPTCREEECRESIELVVELHNMRWRDRGGSDAFHTAGLVEFHREFSRIALKRGWLRLYVLRLNRKPAACLYGFLYRNKFYFYQTGFDPVYRKESVGLVSMGLGIKSAIEDGAVEYDLLHGDEAYKSHWSRERQDLSRMELYPPGEVGRICQKSAAFERSARRIARRAVTELFA